jgi:hypothetical protein
MNFCLTGYARISNSNGVFFWRSLMSRAGAIAWAGTGKAVNRSEKICQPLSTRPDLVPSDIA